MFGRCPKKQQLTDHDMMNGKRGFTLIELSIVLAVLSILYALATPMVSRYLKRAREAALEEDLRSLRKAIDAYHTDLRKYPRTLTALVEKGYIYGVPKDPFTGAADTWIVSETPETDGNVERGILDVHSGSEEIALSGEAVSTW